jgi:hypothetical protein
MRPPVRDARVVTLRTPTPRPPVTSVLAGLVSGWCAISVGIGAKDGRYGGYAMAAILVGWAVVAVTVLLLGGRARPAQVLATPVRAAARRLGRPTAWLAWRITWLSVALMVGLSPPLRHRLYYGHGPYAHAAKWLQITAGLVAGLGVLASLAADTWDDPPPIVARLGRRLTGVGAFATVVVLAACAGIAAVRSASSPSIDVYYLLQQSADGLVHGADMYRQVWVGDLHGGLTDIYPYLPATSVLLAPARLLFGDVRYGLLAALVVAACVLRWRAVDRGAPWMPVVPLLVLIFPEYCYSLEQSWTEPLLVACLAVMVVAVCSGRQVLAVVAFAAALASKQHVALLLPVAALWPAFGPRRTAASAGLAAVFVAPWALASPRAFYHDVVSANIDNPVLNHSLSVPGWANHFGIHLGLTETAVALAAAYWLVWRARGDAVGFAAGGALVLLTAVELNKQAFFNHYTLPMGLLVIAMTRALAEAAPAVPASEGEAVVPGVVALAGAEPDPAA